jgi:hypothetical protein
MADKKKSILEEAILDAKRIQEALNANTKEILRSVAKEEIESLVKESLEEDYMEEDVDDTEEIEDDNDDASVEAGEEIELDDVEGEEEAGEEEEFEIELDDEEGEIEVGDIENSKLGDDLEGDYENGMDAFASDDEIEMDMTTASDEDVIAVYKKLTGDDEIEVVVDDEAGEVKLNVTQPGEFVIKMDKAGKGAEIDMDMDDMDVEAPEEIEDEDEVMYEIALEEGDNWSDANDNTGNLGFDSKKAHAKAEGDMVMSENEEIEEEEIMSEEDVAEGEEAIEEKISSGIGMSVGKHRNPSGPGSIGAPAGPGSKINESKVSQQYKALLTEANELKGKNEEYKQALKQFRTMLAETVVFNSNLTYVTKLFMEHSTTKNEKEAIFKRFDNEVSTLKESKKLYKTIASELSVRKPINESIVNKFDKEVNSSVSKQLNESTVYVDKETSRIMDLMRRVDKR